MSHDVFVSYNEASSKAIMLRVVDHLEKQGVQCWYAPRDVQGQFARSIKRAIDNCSIFVVILNKAASESEYVMDEVALAKKRRGIEILPLHVADMEISDEAEFYLGRFHWVEAIHDLDAGIEDLSERVLKMLGKQKATPAEQTDYITVSYCGQTYRVKAHTINYIDGRVYTGEVLNGKAHGRGKEIWPHGDVYEGDFLAGKYHGKGKFIWSDGGINEGEYAHGVRNGIGTYMSANGFVYEGNFVNDKYHGKGKCFYTDGSIYEGELADDLKCGKGKFVWANGDIYEGDYIADKAAGKGKYTWVNGDVYEGDFHDGKRTGKGKYTWASGAVYEGDHVDGKENGFGTYKSSRGTVLNGRFKDGKYLGK